MINDWYLRTKHDWIVCLFVGPYNPKWSIDDAPDKYIMGMLCLLLVSKHVSVSLLFVNKQSVSWHFVSQFIIDMLFAPSHDDTEQFVKFHHYTLGPHESMGACNSLDWVTCFPLHFTLAYIVYRESRTRQVVYIHVHYGVHGEMYIGIDSRLIDLSLCCIICSQIKKIWVLVAKPELLISCHPIDRQSAVFFPADHRDSTPWLENCPNERTI